MKQFSDFSKRGIDVIVAVSGLLMAAPLLLASAIAIRVILGSPVLFQQERTGFHGRRFRIIKFRTMAEAYDRSGTLLPDARRVTRFGRFLRSTSLDELPELINVLKGEMSVVGPRPLLTEYEPLYSTHHNRRHEVKPGITGWAQVNGRNALTWDDRFDLDVWYVDHRSLALDLKILILTVRAVVLRRGITQQGHATMEKFRGT